MERTTKAIPAVLIALGMLLTLGLGGCQTGKSEGQKQIEDLTSAINGLMGELDSAKTELQLTLDAHQSITENPSGDLLTFYKDFSNGLDKLKKRDASVKEAVMKVDQVGNAYFAQWKASIASFASEDMKKLTQDRYDRTIERFKKVDDQAEIAKGNYEPLMSLLNDHRIFLANDLNAEAAAALAADNEKIKEKSDTLISSIDKVLEFGRQYNKAVSMKVESAPATEGTSEESAP